MNAPTVALVGCGYWGRNLARNFQALGALRTLCDANPATLAGYGSEYDGIARTTDFTSVLADPEISAVVIAAPAAQHYRLAKQALEAGKDVFVEKPLCLEHGEAVELVALATGRQRVLMVGHLLQYHPCVQRLRALVAEGELGKLHYVSSTRLNLGKIRREENALWSFAPHDLSVILSLTGDQLPEQVRCMGGVYLTKGVADTTMTTLRFATDVRAHVYVSWLNPFKEQKLTVVGSNGMAVFDDTRPWNEKLLLYRQYLTWTDGQIPTPSKARAEAIVIPESEPLREECQHFITCCVDRRNPRTDGREGIRVLQVLQAAETSLQRDGEAIDPAAEARRLTASPTPSEYFVHPTAVVDDGATIGSGTKVWHFSHVMKGATIGERCVLGQNVNVDGGVVIGNNVKIQNNVSVYSGLNIEDDVFLGPSCVLTNVPNPRSQVNRHGLYERTLVRRGATVGANATIVCGVTLGRYCFIGAGAVVTRDVPDYALMVGNPARQKGWISRHGLPLEVEKGSAILVCRESGLKYCEFEPGQLRCLDLDENAPLLREMSVGRSAYVRSSLR